MTKKASNRKSPNPSLVLRNRLFDFYKELGLEEPIPDDVPSKWEKHGDLVLLPSGSFQHSVWTTYADEVWNIVASTLKCERVARKNRIQNDNFRTPRVELLKGSDCWVLHTDNKIKYMYDVTKCMFSAGNVSEKLRIAQLDCNGETVVDLYAGIGYFTLPFLLHAGASFVHACEWNPHSVEALAKNLTINGVKEKCIIHFGDNKEVCPQKVADRVNLGLIPSSERAWGTACKALKSSGGVLHVHGNVTSQSRMQSERQELSTHSSVKLEWMNWANYVCTEMKDILLKLYEDLWRVEILDVIRIKSYAPHIDHLVVDIECRPSAGEIK